MSKRRGDGSSMPDFHLWAEVAATVSPLRRPRRAVTLQQEPLPLPAPPIVQKFRRPPLAMPPYQPSGRPGAPQSPALEPRLKRRLNRGQIQIDGTIDLHGMRQAEAHAALTRYIHARSGRGDRTILVITGKGLKKLGDDAAVIVERGVLRAMLPLWLASPELRPLVAGWDIAAQPHGGDGAFYVRLRRPRESA